MGTKYDFLLKTPLFQGIHEDALKPLLKSMHYSTKKYKKDELILHIGDTGRPLGIVLSGKVHIEKCDFWGNKTILDSLGKGQIFAETYACNPDIPLMVSVVARDDCEIMFLEVLSLLADKAHSHSEQQILTNLFRVSARKNLILSQRIFHTSPKTIRGRLISYLSAQATLSDSPYFDIDFDRQQLADYLNVDRSALSAELGRMKREGLIDFQKNSFKLINLE